MNNSKNNKRFYYGWFIVAGGFISMAIAYSLRYSYSIFSIELEEQLNWSRAEIYTAFSVLVVVYGCSSPLVGRILDRHGPRVLYPCGALILGLAMLATSQVKHLWQFYLLAGISAAGMACLGFVANGALVSRWFERRRGLATGIVMSGTGFGMFVIIGFFIPWVIAGFGFRAGYVILGLLAIGIVVPLGIFVMRSGPADVNQLMDGGQDPDGTSVDATAHRRMPARVVDPEWANQEWTIRSALRTHRFWALLVMTMSFPFGLYSVMLHQVQYAVDAGFDVAVASGAFGMIGFWGMVGKFTWGAISDRVGREMAWLMGSVCFILGVLVLLSIDDPSDLAQLYLFGALFGLGYAIAQPLGTAMTADLFQGRNFGAIFGCLAVGTGLGGALGPVFSGYIHDVTNSYQTAFFVAILLVATSTIAVWVAGPRKVRRVQGRAQPPTRPLGQPDNG